MADTLWEVQSAVYGALSATLSVPVYDDVPAEAALPYVTIGDAVATSEDDKTGRGETVLIDVHVWSSYRGRKEVRQLLSSIRDALHRQALVVAGADLVWISHAQNQDFIDADGVTRHGVARFRVRLAW